MSTSKHQIQVKANDQTAAGFKSIKDRAAATGSQINSILRGAITAAAGYLSFRTIHNGIQELGRLSDIAQKAGVSVEELTKMEGAMGFLGIQGMNVEAIATAFKYMEKATGRQGMKGFYETIAEIAKIPDASKRAEEAMRVFSSAGQNFIPLINAAENGTDALKDLIAKIGGVKDSAAEAGDAAADALSWAMREIKIAWLNGLGGIIEILGGSFASGIRTSSAIAVSDFIGNFRIGVVKLLAWMDNAFFSFFDRVAEGWDILSGYIANNTDLMLEKLGSFGNNIAEGWDILSSYFSKNAKWMYDCEANPYYSWGDAAADAAAASIARRNKNERWYGGNSYYSWGDAAADAADKSIARRNAREAAAEIWKGAELELEREREKRRAELEEIGKKLNAAAKANGRNEKTPEQKKEEVEVVKRASRAISNSLMMAGSAEALKLQMLGPRTEAEQKKQTKLLEKIEKNTAETAESGEDVEVALS